MNKNNFTKNKLNKKILESSNLTQLLNQNYIIITISLNPNIPTKQYQLKTTKLHHSIVKNNHFYNDFFHNTLIYSIFLTSFTNHLDFINYINDIDSQSLSILKFNNVYFNMNKYSFKNSFVENNYSLLNKCLFSIIFQSSKE